MADRPDMLHVIRWHAEPVRAAHHRRVGFLFGLTFGLILGALAVRAVYAATPRPAQPVIADWQWQQVAPATAGRTEAPSMDGSRFAATEARHVGDVDPVAPDPRGRLDGASTILDPFPASPRPERATVAVPEPVLVVREKAVPRAASSKGGGWRVSVASWYGPGFYGHRTACGQTLTEGLVGVAHKTLPCGTAVTFRAGGRVVTAPVVDRGPYIAGREWDLTAGLCAALGRCSTGAIEWRL